MSILFHYFVCVFNYLRKYAKLFFIRFCNRFTVLFRFIKCLILLKKPANNTAAEYDLSHYYPDSGRLSDRRGYKNGNTAFDLSIIIPIYNSQKYIEECLNSILLQKTDYSYEIILVDDGSTDGSVSVIKQYLEKSNIKLISQRNSGQSVARNKALYESSGRYIMFIDSDDILLPGAIESLMVAAIKSGSDIVEGSIVRFINSITDEMIKDSTKKACVKSYSKEPKFVLTSYGYSVAKVYKRELWETLRFPENYIFEDVITKFILRRKANSVFYIGNVVYGYRIYESYSSHSKNHLKKLDSIWVLPKIIELCDQEHAPKDGILYLLALNHIGLLNFVVIKSLGPDIKLAAFSEMRKQLNTLSKLKPEKMPLWFRLLNKSIKENNFDAWQYIAETIIKYRHLKKRREIN